MSDSPGPQRGAAGEYQAAGRLPRTFVAGLEDDQRARWQRGERRLVEAYLKEHPELGGDPEAVVDLIYNEFLLRRQLRETPVLEEYLTRFPDLTGPIRAQLKVHGALGVTSRFRSGAGAIGAFFLLRGGHVRFDLDTDQVTDRWFWSRKTLPPHVVGEPVTLHGRARANGAEAQLRVKTG
jgi:hypothetical protein